MNEQESKKKLKEKTLSRIKDRKMQKQKHKYTIYGKLFKSSHTICSIVVMRAFSSIFGCKHSRWNVVVVIRIWIGQRIEMFAAAVYLWQWSGYMVCGLWIWKCILLFSPNLCTHKRLIRFNLCCTNILPLPSSSSLSSCVCWVRHSNVCRLHIWQRRDGDRERRRETEMERMKKKCELMHAILPLL